MPPPDDLSALRDIRDAARFITQAIADVRSGRHSDTDGYVLRALEREFAVIGEAVKRLTMEFRERHPSVPWREWAGLRDVLVHAYDVIDHPQLWDYAATDVPPLLEFLEQFEVD
jgi:uncharacterized protein with HEPN domain